jgi:Tfp pilus assembly protein PilF
MSRFDHIRPEETAEETAVVDAYGFDHYFDAAGVAHTRGAFEKALRYYGRALEQERARPEAWLGQVRALLDMGQPQEAMTWMEQAAGVLGERPDLLALRAIACARQGDIDDARAWSDRSMRAGRDSPAVWLARAEVVYATGGDKMARVNLEKAHERGRTAAVARRCGEVALNAGDLAAARRWLERAAREAPESPLAALRLGVFWERAGDGSKAKLELSRALSLEPHMESARLALDELEGRGVVAKLRAAWRRWNL